MSTQGGESLSDAIDEQDVAAFDLAHAAIMQKVLPKIMAHQGHGCALGDPNLLEAALNTAALLRALMEAFNEARASKGKPPRVEFSQGVLRKGSGWDA